MNYAEMIDRAMKGRSVNSLAKAWGLQQRTLDRYVKGQSMPDYETALKIAKEAGVEPGEAFEVLVTEERSHKARSFKLQMGFVQITLLALMAGGSLMATVYIM
ncbi:helix-turn-helix domain-containing protein [Rugamonas rubra]|uniref:helix-turn-helix domain-containing protein n=1 Tax=Rugamonas rubra TaxID=758825 RepID=UPI000B89C8C6|nr:helix-turn-helix transcriptional regulator [Rugamonas rubra]